MRRFPVFVFLVICMCYPLKGFCQWEFFEHRYKYELTDVIEADRLVQKDGYWEAYRKDELAGYVFLSKEWTKKLVGYSGKHIETLIGIDTKGVLTGVRIIFHSEPIVLIGLKEKNYQKFMKQYPGKSILQDLSVGKGISMDAITGATITAVVQNAIILGSSRKVASQTGMMKFVSKPKRKISKKFTALSWKKLLDSGALKNIVITSRELGMEGKDIYLDLYFGLITPPSIGRNILGNDLYRETIRRLKKGESAVVVVSRGNGSFKGSGFARGGLFDRFHLEQADRMYVFKDKDYRILTNIKAQGAPKMKEGGLFIIRGKDFEQTSPFTFQIVMPYREKGFKRKIKSYTSEYILPDNYLE